LARAAHANPQWGVQATLVFRQKRTTSLDRIRQLQDEGLRVHLVPGGLHWWTQQQLSGLLKLLAPDVVVVHGYPEHLIGREAAIAAGVSRLIHVEHNSRERYNRASLKRALQLTEKTECIVGVSESVCDNLKMLGFPAGKLLTIPNGVDVQRFVDAGNTAWCQRESRVMMCARFSSQKDHASLIRAAAVMKLQGVSCPVWLAGTGKWLHMKRAVRLSRSLGVHEDVRFLGHIPDVATRLGGTKIFVLSSHFEGMPLAVIEAMAAGCLVIGTDAPGIRDVIRSGKNGWLVPASDPNALADRIQSSLQDVQQSTHIAHTAQCEAMALYSPKQFAQRHNALYSSEPTQ
jgi:glycosyltransferase involved in cell wall biosynthesis